MPVLRGGSATPGFHVRDAESHEKRFDGNAPRRVERESVGYVGQGKGTELFSAQCAGDEYVQEEVRQAGSTLIRYPPAEARTHAASLVPEGAHGEPPNRYGHPLASCAVLR